ncbi:hypothetical protein [Nocardia yamanashiensis]|uniref:hypothetical protein n=1 Tax=Nocardia yamanashiensis TaxID=209247 RepID=UPI000AE525CE|nr:hypothetical protein [Nocardia yamanashiensis]
MEASTPTRRAISWGIKGVTIAAAIAALNPAPAAATIEKYWVADSRGNITTEVVAGQAYRIHAITTGSVQRIAFWEADKCIGSDVASVFGGADATASVVWVPGTVGVRSLAIVQAGADYENLTVTVAPAPAGSTPAEQPKQDACIGGGGSIDTRSLGF